MTHGIGGILLRKLLMSKEPWQKKLKIGRVVQVTPPNQGSALMTWAAQFALFRKILGPVLEEMSPEDAKHFPWIRKGIEVGVIIPGKENRWWCKMMPKSITRVLNKKDEAYLKEAKETILIKNRHLNPFKNKRIVNACLNFLQKGNFS